jgi:hypothetical protein
VYVIGYRGKEPQFALQSDYVNPKLCSGCHPLIARTYAFTGMARSFSQPRAETTVEDYKVNNGYYHRASGRYYTMVNRDGKFFQRRYQTGFDGKPTNVLEMEVQYVIGSGNHARSYLHRTADGKLIELPITWYSEKGGYWAMSPRLRPRRSSRFSPRNIVRVLLLPQRVSGHGFNRK